MKQLIRKMIEFGNKIIQSIQYGSHTISEVWFGNHKIYPDGGPIPPTPVITSYTITNIYTHMSSGDKIKVNGSNYAYITATVTELHDGKVYRSFTETATTLSFPDTRLVQRGSNIYYNVNSQWAEIETIYQRVNVSFTMYGITKTTNIPVEANEAVIEYLTAFVADSSPANIINADGEDVYIYARFENTKRTTYTSGYIDDDYQGRVPGYVNIYIKYNDSYWVLRRSHIETSTSGQYTSIEHVPANVYEPQAVYFKIEDASGQSPDVILSFRQDTKATCLINWTLHNLDIQQVSMSFDDFDPVPSRMVPHSTLIFYIKDIDQDKFTTEPNIKENGIAKDYTIDPEGDTAYKITVGDVNGNLTIEVYGIEPDTPTPPVPVTKYRINLDYCLSCGNCLDTCKYGAVSVNDDDEYTINPIKCVGCAECVEVCPDDRALEEYMP